MIREFREFRECILIGVKFAKFADDFG